MSIHITVRGNRTYTVILEPVIVLSIITVDSFFDEQMLVMNLALLGIPPNKIQTVDVVRESRRRQFSEKDVGVTVQIGKAPVPFNSSSNSSTEWPSREHTRGGGGGALRQ